MTAAAGNEEDSSVRLQRSQGRNHRLRSRWLQHMYCVKGSARSPVFRNGMTFSGGFRGKRCRKMKENFYLGAESARGWLVSGSQGRSKA